MQKRNAARKTPAVAMMLAAAFAATHAAAQAPAPKGPPAGPPDFLDAVNETASSVKLEFFSANTPPGPDARAHMMACMSPKQTLRWPLAPETPVGRIRMQVMGGNGCDEPQKVVCERSIDRVPGLQYITLRGEGNNCGVFPMPAPARGGMLQAAGDCGPSGVWAPLTIKNTTNYGVWATLYENVHRMGGPPILYAACWMPYETRMACVEKRKYIVRAQVVGNERWAVAKSCSERVYRDTNYRGQIHGALVDMGANPNGFLLTMTCPGHECRWEYKH